jgi:hypothetical protein
MTSSWGKPAAGLVRIIIGRVWQPLFFVVTSWSALVLRTACHASCIMSVNASLLLQEK